MAKEKLGDERKFFTPVAVSIDWIAQAVAALARLRNPGDYFDGYIYLASGRLVFAAYDEWIQELARHGEAVTESVANFSAFRLGTDHRRGIATIEIRGADEKELDAAFGHIAETLTLSPFVGNPYRYRRTAATYRIGSFDRNEAAAGLELVARNVAGRLNPLVRQAYAVFVAADKVEGLSGFEELPELLNFLRTTKAELHEIGFAIEGLRGVAVGINFNVTGSLLTLRTSKESNEIGDLLSPLQGPLALKLVEGRQVGSTNEAGRASTEPWWVKHVVTLMATTSIFGGLVAEFGRAYVTSYDVELVQPVLDRDVAQAEGQRVALEWYLRPQSSLRSNDYTARSTVIVVQSGQPDQRSEETRTSPTTLDLKPGRYVVEIRPLTRANPVHFTLVVPAKP